MIFSNRTPSGGVWHCPFTPEWGEKMKRAAKHCESLSEAYIKMTLDHAPLYYDLPPGDFLSEPQDARGLPLSWCEQEESNYRNRPNCCTAIYDYCSIPEIMVTNGFDDWPYDTRFKVLQA